MDQDYYYDQDMLDAEGECECYYQTSSRNPMGEYQDEDFLGGAGNEWDEEDQYDDDFMNEDSTLSMPINDSCWGCCCIKGCVNCKGTRRAKLCTNCNSCCDAANSQNCESCHTVENCSNCKDSQYCTDCTDCNNCINIEQCSDCQYCLACIKCDDCYNCEDCDNCERCDTVVSCTKCVRCKSCYDCYCCNNCIDCVGLSHAQYVIKGVQYTRTQFKRYQLAVKFGYASKDNSKNGLLDLPEDICVCRDCGKLFYNGINGQCQDCMDPAWRPVFAIFGQMGKPEQKAAEQKLEEAIAQIELERRKYQRPHHHYTRIELKEMKSEKEYNELIKK